MHDLNIEPATTHPLATQEIDGMIEMIKTLIDKGYAYDADFNSILPEQESLRIMENFQRRILMI